MSKTDLNDIEREHVDAEELHELAQLRADPTVTLYLPTERAVYQPQQNSTRLKTLLKSVEEQLTDRPDTEGMVAPLRDLLGENQFWLHQLEGLALITWSDQLRRYRLPFAVEELAVVADAPHLTPMLPAMSTQGHGYVVAVSQQQVRVLRMSPRSARELDTDAVGIPQGLEAVLGDEEISRPELQSHATGPGGTAHVFHGHGTGEEDEKEQLARYCRAVDAGVRRLVGRDTAPVVLFAVEPTQTLYREASELGSLLPDGVGGSPDHLPTHEIQHKAWPLIAQRLAEPVHTAVQRYHERIGTGLASADLAAVLHAAHTGRVETVLVRRGRRRWGRFDLDAGTVEERAQPRHGDVDLIDLAVRRTLTLRGTAYALDDDDMPADADVAAVHRF